VLSQHSDFLYWLEELKAAEEVFCQLNGPDPLAALRDQERLEESFHKAGY
jgi:hypothetical protein